MHTYMNIVEFPSGIVKTEPSLHAVICFNSFHLFYHSVDNCVVNIHWKNW